MPISSVEELEPLLAQKGHYMKNVNILDISQFEDHEDSHQFYCNRLSTHLKEHNKHISVPHKHNFFLTVLFTEGSGIHEVDFERYEVTPGAVFLINPGQTHYWELSNAEGIIFFHSQSFFDLNFTNRSVLDFPFFYSIHNPSMLFLEEPTINNVVHWFDALLVEYRDQKMHYLEKIQTVLNCLYVDLSRLYDQSGMTKITKTNIDFGYIRRLENLIDEHYKAEKSPSFYAERLSITPKHLNRLTRNTLGKTTTQIITERVILEAKRLVLYHPRSLTDVSNELGFEEYAYFTRLFKKWTGSTPTEFRDLYH